MVILRFERCFAKQIGLFA